MLYNEIMKKRKYDQTFAALILSAALIFTGIPVNHAEAAEQPAKAVEEKNELSGNAIEITSAEDLIALSEKSSDESETQGKYYVLTNDIDLSGTKFKPVSIFSGVFDGQGHTIKGFELGGNASQSGLIRSVGKTGCIRNLCVSGNLSPEGEMKEIGGIAGRNYGVLDRVTFSGYVLGAECVGGITGHNMEEGRIISCSSDAIVLGTRRSGGIAGFNEGIIESSVNSGNINAEKTTAWETDDARSDDHVSFDSDTVDELDDTNESLAQLNPDMIDLKDDDIKEKLSDKLKINYTGGIAGASSGVIKECENRGVVGYKHTGYKTGGIVGYERGILTGCVNNGEVYGRKDVGGIAGQFEPYVVNKYSEDSFSKAGDQLDDLVDMADKLHNTVGKEDDKAQNNIDAIRGTADELRQTVSDYKTYYQCKNDSVEREIRSQVDGIRSTIDSIDPDIYDNDTKNALQALKDNVEDLEKLLDSAEEAAGRGITVDMTNYMDKLLRMLASGNDSLSTLLGKASEGTDDLEELGDQLSDIRDKSGALDDYLKGCIDDYKKDIRTTDDDITGKTDSLATQMDTLLDGLKESDASVRGQLNTITGQMQTINSTLNDGFDEVQDELERIRQTEDIDDVFDDVSDDPDRTPGKGSLNSSINNSRIDADINVGGIVGYMDYDYDTQSDFEVVSAGEISLNYERTRKATILDCTNRGEVSVRNDYAGGIVGRAEMGAVLSGNNFGRISSEEGNFVGGIAGKSAYVIRDSYSMSEVSGNTNVGGIAGYVKVLTGSACLSNVGGSNEKTGAVAGEADPESDIRDNVFVLNETGAINGCTVEKEAKPITYGELINKTGVPEEFREMRVDFTDGGKIIKTFFVKYGGSIRESLYPPVPEGKKGRFAYWENIDLTNIKQNTTVHAIYVDYVTTIATAEENPKLLITGDFYDHSDVVLEETSVNMPAPRGYSIAGAYKYSVHGVYGARDDDYVLRFLKDGYGDNIAAAEVKDNKVSLIPSKVDGNYIVFAMKGDGEFVILKKNSRLWQLFIIGGMLVILIGLVVIFKKKNRKAK